MIVEKNWKKFKYGKIAVYRGWYLFGFIPLYIKIEK